MNIERKLIILEYEIDALTHHVLMRKCDCVKPKAMKRLFKCLGIIRSLRDYIRKGQKFKQRTITDHSTIKGVSHNCFPKNYDCY